MTGQNRELTDHERHLVRWMLVHGSPEAVEFLPQLELSTQPVAALVHRVSMQVAQRWRAVFRDVSVKVVGDSCASIAVRDNPVGGRRSSRVSKRQLW